MNWISALSALSNDNKGFVIVTVLSVEGSAPRDPKTKMIVTEDHAYDSVGGGNLEYQAIAKGRELLRANRSDMITETFVLGKDLTQCCGGKVEVLFEPFPACNFHIIVFGAGHVGKALITVLSGLPCRVQWIDSRENQFPDDDFFWRDKENIKPQLMLNPHQAVENCPPDAHYLVMTHSHEIDFDLCEAILSRRDAAFCGLIGSKSKAAKFRSRLSRKQFTAPEIDNLTSPIGLPDIPGKTPMSVAVSIAAQLLKLNKNR